MRAPFYIQIFLIPSFHLLQRPAASWRLHQHPARSRSCDSAPSPPPTTQSQERKEKMILISLKRLRVNIWLIKTECGQKLKTMS